MKPFLILQLRDVDAACENEFQAILSYGELKPDQAQQIRMEQQGIPDLDLTEYSGVIVGGGPTNVSDPIGKKSKKELQFESDLVVLLARIIEEDYPFLGTCYGFGALANALGADVSKKNFGEQAGTTTISLTEKGKADPLLQGLPEKFRALTGHKEACQQLPIGAKLLATSDCCPYQIIRYRNNVYATQFHPEMDVKGLKFRMEVYKEHGYFDLNEMSSLMASLDQEEIIYPPMILKNFVTKYAIL